MKRADLREGGLYLGGKGHRLREVTRVTNWSVTWRDADPESIDYNWLAQTKGSCEPKVFASWAKREVTPEELKERLAIPKREREEISATIPTVDIVPFWREHRRKPKPSEKGF
ncbi:hypothetical protein ACQPTN_00650 [Bradyrhizobium sp. 13971]|uniref:hypothetical protein n=1 Tax=Bradyrhizobium elkanii TaxID=29448 RepID=UPI000841EFC6|nr:hypothetical protein [Bradyrhizobium elkanii]ODM84331.1 hypothetical protein A6452_16425 [Bradyrhizobium elkanii]ODM86281.1 hypothetical protein A6X20_01135 [Bradyrhizobium elkanii]